MGDNKSELRFYLCEENDDKPWVVGAIKMASLMRARWKPIRQESGLDGSQTRKDTDENLPSMYECLVGEQTKVSHVEKLSSSES
jgi:hypothetical protein